MTNENKTQRKIIMVNGLPATGKTSVGRDIAEYYHAPLITLDTLKEPMFDELGVGDREYNRTLSRTCKKIIWAEIRDFPKDAIVVLDAWFGLPPNEDVKAGLESVGAEKAVEIWCHASGEILKERYISRVGLRHPAHPGAEFGDELAQRANTVVPMDFCQRYDIDTGNFSSIDFDDLHHWLDEKLF